MSSSQQGADAFTGEFFSIFKKLTPILLKLCPPKKRKSKKGKHSQPHFMKPVLPDTKLDKDTIRKLQANISDEYSCKNSQQYTSKPNLVAHQKGHTPLSNGTYSWDSSFLLLKAKLQ